MSYIDRFETELLKIITEEIADKERPVCSGIASSFDDYKFRCGQLNALSHFPEIIERAKENIGAA